MWPVQLRMCVLLLEIRVKEHWAALGKTEQRILKTAEEFEVGRAGLMQNCKFLLKEMTL